MPLAAVIGESISCVHGGISHGLTSLSQIQQLPRPLAASPDNTLVWGMLWNDPCDAFPGFRHSARHSAATFGKQVLREFLTANGLSYVLRGHQCVDGVQATAGMPLSTVFSSSNYRGENACGVVVVAATGAMYPKIFPTRAHHLTRADVTFEAVERPSVPAFERRRRDSGGLVKSCSLLARPCLDSVFARRRSLRVGYLTGAPYIKTAMSAIQSFVEV
jgi:hypothetical protein